MRHHNRPQHVVGLSGHFIEDIAVGSEHTLALTSVGDVYAWGSNGDGQLGLGHTGAVREPQLVPGLSNKGARQVSPGLGQLCQQCQLLGRYPQNSATKFSLLDGLILGDYLL